MSSWGLFGIFASSCCGKGRELVSFIFHTIILPVVVGLASLSPYTMRMLGIHSYGVLPSYK
jgi:hypothetical protein